MNGPADLPGAHLINLVATMDRLRVDCPWEARRRTTSLAPHLLEEPYEALEALESGDEEAFRGELGDVLLQVVFHARIAAERDDGTGFTIDYVADGIVAKLVRRHPHVFGDVRGWAPIRSSRTGTRSSGKRRELRPGGPRRPRAGDAADSVLDSVPFGQPALALAAQLQRRAARAGVPDRLALLERGAGSGRARWV